MEYTHHYDSPLGGITLTSDGSALTGLRFDGQKKSAVTLTREHAEKPLPVFDETERWLDLYFSGKAPDFTPPLTMAATPFRIIVWNLLLTIPYGQTTTYGEVAFAAAKKMGIPRMSAQAVGGAVGSNPIALIVPCHRVIGADGSLTGYGGGLDKKIKLLTLERSGAIGSPVS